MNNALWKLIAPKRRSFIWPVALATAGSALYFSGVKDSRATLCVSCPAPFCSIFSPQWRTSFYKWNISTGNLPLLVSRIDSNPARDTRKEDSSGISSVGVGEGSNCCSGCLHRDTIVIAASKVCPAVVNLSVPQGFSGLTLGKSIGSGTIISSDGTILTCAHVVVDSQGGLKAKSNLKVDVTLQDGRTFEGMVVNADLRSDIAIVKIDSTTPLPTANLGSSSKLRPGEWVIAMGCPLSLQNTITAGIISCVDRKSSDLGLGGVRREYLQTDCAINEGNSGGPLVNIDGEIVGVNILKVLAADGLGFAVPIDSVLKIMDQFKKNGKVVRGWVGLKMIELNEMIIAQLKGRDSTFPNVSKGLLVALVTPGSPADGAGFRAGDVVIEFGGKHVESIKEVVDILDEKVGVAVSAVVLRGKDPPLALTIVPQPANPDM